MKKFVSLEKLSKKRRREENAKRRRTWGALSPVTRVSRSKKARDRLAARGRIREDENSYDCPVANAQRFM